MKGGVAMNTRFELKLKNCELQIDNIKGILSCLYGKSIRQPKVRDLMRMKCHYVALTRASGLVCVALPISSVKEEEIVLLQQNGWNVVKL